MDKCSKTRHATNVTKIARAILPRDSRGIDQVVYYHEGVGTSRGLDHYTGGAFGEGIENNIRDLYRFIVYNYAPGDQEVHQSAIDRHDLPDREYDPVNLKGCLARVGLRRW